LLLQWLRDKKGERFLMETVEKTDTPDRKVLSAISELEPGSELDELLTKLDLLCLKPVPKEDLSAWVQQQLSNRDVPPGDVLQRIEKELGDPKVTCVYMAPIVGAAACSRVFSIPGGKPDVDALIPLFPLLGRVTQNDEVAQAQILFQVQEAWFKANRPNCLKDLFESLYKAGVVSVSAITTWQSDRTNKTAGKAPALLKVNAWIETLPKPRDRRESGDEGDEGDEGDDYLTNYNRD
jgi:hypothetical protein